MAELSLLHCFPAFLAARKVVQHGAQRDVEIELRFGTGGQHSTVTREEFLLIAKALEGADHTTDWVNSKDSFGKTFRKSVTADQTTYIEKTTIEKQSFTTGSPFVLTITAKLERACDPMLLGGMCFETERRKLRKSFTFKNLRFDLTIVWVTCDGKVMPPQYEVEVELLQQGGFSATKLAGQLLDTGIQLVNILQPGTGIATISPANFQ